ncbi:MAG: 30S ribosomal protein S1 [Bdellovibrionales bacterium]|nr:30S ribosomal protein S1 [Bdellovibrionales bacterium]
MNTGSQAGDSSNGDFNSFASAFEAMDDQLAGLRAGSVVKGTIVELGKDYARVDIGFKLEGIVPIEQFKNAKGEKTHKVGDVIEVYIVHLENDFGQLILSHEKAVQKRVWGEVEKIFEKDGIVKGTIVQKVKGGLQVDIGVPAFLPGSQVDIRPHRNLDRFLGEEHEFKVLKVTRDKGNIVLSRRAVLMHERDELRSETLQVLGEGVVMEGVVKNITDYGVFIDLGGIDGLLHITDISWGRVNHPSDKLSVGEKVPVVVLKYDKEKERVSLGMKQLKQDPWETIDERYANNATVKGKVISLADYGAFVELEEGVEGLVHVSEMSWTKKVRNPSNIMSVGDYVEAVVLGIDREQRRVSLGMKQLMPNPWRELSDRLIPGTRVKGKVRSITEFGIFVGIEDGIDGLVHVSDFSWTKRIKDPEEISKLFSKGDEVEAVVLEVDVDNERLSLGIKQLETDPWDTIAQRYPVGVKIKGKVSSLTDFGVFVEIEDGIEGLIHNSQLGLKRDEDAKDHFKVGDEVEAEVTAVDRAERRISLSIKSIQQREERANLDQFSGDSGGAVTIGDLLREKMSSDD